MTMEQIDMVATTPTRNIAANIHVEHTQLRDLIACPTEKGDILYASTSGLSARNLKESEPTERVVPGVSFAPTCVATGSGLIAAGGVHAELFLAPISAIPPSSSSSNLSLLLNPPKDNWTSKVRLHGSINNAIFFTDLALASSPYHLPTSYDAVGQMPRLFVSNNDCTMRVYNVATQITPSTDASTDDLSKKKQHSHRLRKAGVLQAKTCVNHASISPDGRTLLMVGDTPSVYLYGIDGGANVTFSPSATHEHAFTDAAFSTAWSSDGLSYAVASQDGGVKVWDVRSSIPLAEMRGVESRRRWRPSPSAAPLRGNSGRSARFVPPGLDPPLADGSQFMSSSHTSPHPLSAVYSIPTSALPNYYGYSFLDGGGHFGTPGSVSGATVVPSNASISPPIVPDKEMDLVVPGIRSLKFVRSGGRDVLAFTEQLSHVHLVDAQTFNEHVILRVPPLHAPAPSLVSNPLNASSHNANRRRSLSVHDSRSISSLHIPPFNPRPEVEPPRPQDPWPASAWCSPSESPSASPRTQNWPTGTILPSIHDAEEQERRHSHAQPPPPMLYADLRSNASSASWTGYRPVPPPPSSAVDRMHDSRMPPSSPSSSPSSRGFVASGISGATYEFMLAPSQSSIHRLSAGGQRYEHEHVSGSVRPTYNIEEGEIEGGEEAEDKPFSPQDSRIMSMPSHNASTRHLPPPIPVSAYTQDPLPPAMSAPSTNNTNIRIVHHPATRTRLSYDEKHMTTHLSGMTFDPSGRWMYVSTERSIAEWDLRDVLGGGSTSNSKLSTWGETILEAGGEWA